MYWEGLWVCIVWGTLGVFQDSLSHCRLNACGVITGLKIALVGTNEIAQLSNDNFNPSTLREQHNVTWIWFKVSYTCAATFGTLVVTQRSHAWRALLNTGTEWNGTEYTGTWRNEMEWTRMVPEWWRNETEWTRMVPEYTETSRNDGGMKRNVQEWYRNIPERAGMTPLRREKTLVQRQNKPQKHQNVAD